MPSESNLTKIYYFFIRRLLLDYYFAFSLYFYHSLESWRSNRIKHSLICKRRRPLNRTSSTIDATVDAAAISFVAIVKNASASGVLTEHLANMISW